MSTNCSGLSSFLLVFGYVALSRSVTGFFAVMR